MNAWSIDIAIQKLDEALHPPALVGGSRKDLPRRTRMPVQQIIDEWDYLRQRILLRQIAAQLLVMRMKMPPEMVALVDEYRNTIESYLTKRDKAGVARSLPGVPATRADAVVRDVVKKLNDLDQARGSFGQPKPTDTNALPGAGK